MAMLCAAFPHVLPWNQQDAMTKCITDSSQNFSECSYMSEGREVDKSDTLTLQKGTCGS